MLRTRSFAVLGAIALAVAVSQSFGRFSYSVLLTDIRDDLGLSNTVAGTLGSANLAAYLLGSLVVSVVIGRLGLTRVARSGLIGVTIGLCFLAWAPNVAAVAGGLVITGFAAAGVWVTAPALATAELGPERRASAIGLTSAGVGGGMLLSSWLDTQVDWRGVYRIEVVVAVGAVALSLALIPRVRRTQTSRLGMGAIKDVPGWKPLLTAYGLYGAGMALVITFLIALLEDDAGYSPSRASFAFSALAIGSVVGGPTYGWFIDRAGRRAGLLSSFAFMAVTSTVILTGHRPGATIAAFLFGTSFTGVPVAVGARIADLTEGDRFGAAYGVATLVFGVGLTVGPQLGGWLSDATGSFRPAFVIAAVVAVVGIVLTPSATPGADPSVRIENVIDP